MKLLGLTGGIGSGKTTVARLLASSGLPVVDADAIARQIVEPGSPTLSALAEEFGTDILNQDGSLNRAKLASLAFASPSATSRLNAITHPAIDARAQQEFRELEKAGYPWAVYDMPLLVERGLDSQMDRVVVVTVDPETRVQRLVQHRGLDAADARRRIAAQATETERLAVADYVVDNNGAQEDLVPQVEKMVAALE